MRLNSVVAKFNRRFQRGLANLKKKVFLLIFLLITDLVDVDKFSRLVRIQASSGLSS